MEILDQIYMARFSKKKAEYIAQLQLVVAGYGSQLTVKQLKALVGKYC